MALSPIFQQMIARAIPSSRGALAERLARAESLGFTTPVHHTSRYPRQLEAFEPRRGSEHKDIPATHVGTPDAARERAYAILGPPRMADEQRLAGVHTYPLVARIEKPYLSKSNEGMVPHREAALSNQVMRERLPEHIEADIRIGAITPSQEKILRQDAFRERLLSEGYDTVPYYNSAEDVGNTSHMILRPENLRSVFAQFDPAKRHLADIMAQRWLVPTAATGGAAAIAAGGAENT